MKVTYFSDTDTALIELSDEAVAETRDVSEDITIDFAADGRLVSITIEHAKTVAHLPELTFQEV